LAFQRPIQIQLKDDARTRAAGNDVDISIAVVDRDDRYPQRSAQVAGVPRRRTSRTKQAAGEERARC
jgi:hypothetical protein